MDPEIPEYIRKLKESGYLDMLPMLCQMATIEMSDFYTFQRDWAVPTASMFATPDKADRWLAATAYIIPHGTLVTGSVDDRIDAVVRWIVSGHYWTTSNSSSDINTIKDLIK